MSRNVLLILVVFVSTLNFGVAASAQEIPSEVERLFERLAGDWQIVSTMEDITATDRLTGKRTANGEGIIWQWAGKDIDSGQVATSVGLMGWDGQKRVVVENMVSSNGVTFSATWQGSGDRWESKTRNMELIDGEYKTLIEDRVVEWESDDKVIIVSTNRLLSGKPRPNITSVFERQK